VTAAAEGHSYEVLSRQERFHGPLFDVVTDDVTMPGGGRAHRDYLRHVGAVGVVALDGDGRVVLVHQYRHAVAQVLWELPAGLVDVPGEASVGTAQRELAEEADLRADRWDLLVDLYTSPGCSTELFRAFLARDLHPVPDDERHERHDEEAELTVRLVDLDEAVAMIFRGEILNGPTVAALLAAASARDGGWATLRPAQTPRPPTPRTAPA